MTRHKWFSMYDAQKPEMEETFEIHVLCEADSWLKAFGHIGLCPELFPFTSLPRATITVEKRVRPLQTSLIEFSKPNYPDSTQANLQLTAKRTGKTVSTPQSDLTPSRMAMTESATSPKTVFETVWVTSWSTSYETVYETEDVEVDTDGRPIKTIWFDTDGLPTTTLWPVVTPVPTSSKWYKTDDAWFGLRAQSQALIVFCFALVCRYLLWRCKRAARSRSRGNTQSSSQSRNGEATKPEPSLHASSSINTTKITKSMSNFGKIGKKANLNSSTAVVLSQQGTRLREPLSTPAQEYLRKLQKVAQPSKSRTLKDLMQGGLKSSEDEQDNSETWLLEDFPNADSSEAKQTQDDGSQPIQASKLEVFKDSPQDECETSAEDTFGSLLNLSEEAACVPPSMIQGAEVLDEASHIFQTKELEVTENVLQDLHESSPEEADVALIEPSKEAAEQDDLAGEEQGRQNKHRQTIPPLLPPNKSPTTVQDHQFENVTEKTKQVKAAEQISKRKEDDIPESPASVKTSPTDVNATIPDLKTRREPIEIKETPGVTRNLDQKIKAPDQERPLPDQRPKASARRRKGKPKAARTDSPLESIAATPKPAPQILEAQAKPLSMTEGSRSGDPWAGAVESLPRERPPLPGFVHSRNRYSDERSHLQKALSSEHKNLEIQPEREQEQHHEEERRNVDTQPAAEEQQETTEMYAASPEKPQSKLSTTDLEDRSKVQGAADEDTVVKSHGGSGGSSDSDSLFHGDINPGEFVGTPPPSS